MSVVPFATELLAAGEDVTESEMVAENGLDREVHVCLSGVDVMRAGGKMMVTLEGGKLEEGDLPGVERKT